MMMKQPFLRAPLTPKPSATVSVKMPQKGWLISNRNCWRSEIGVPARSGSGGDPLQGCRHLVPLAWQKMSEPAPWPLPVGTLTPFMT